MRRDSVTIGKRQISYLLSEPAASAGVAPPARRPLRTVVFLHAFPMNATMWESTLSATPEGWQAVAPDLRGFGESPLPQSFSHGMAELARDVVDLLDHLEVGEAVVFGCSMGGYVLFEMLRSTPAYVSALGLVSTRPGADNEEGRKNRQKTIELVEREGVEALAAQMIPKLLGASTQRDRPDLVKHTRNLILSNSGEGIKAAIAAMMERSDSTALLAGINVPTLIVAGAEDTLIPPAEAEAMHAVIPTSRHELMPFAGHLPNLEQPAAFDALVFEFLQNL